MAPSNYPPGVTGNEPQITGIWPIEGVIDGATEDIKKGVGLIEDALIGLADQMVANGLGDLDEYLLKLLEDIDRNAEDILSEIGQLIPEESDWRI
jgi:hypothetical protein